MKAMELIANTNNVFTTISENGTEDRKLSNGTIVISFVWNEEAERSSYRVGIITGSNKSNSVTFAIIFFQEDVNEPGCYRKLTDGIEAELEATIPETILLATVTGSKTVPSYPESLAFELDTSIETRVSLIKVDGSSSKNRLDNQLLIL